MRAHQKTAWIAALVALMGASPAHAKPRTKPQHPGDKHAQKGPAGTRPAKTAAAPPRTETRAPATPPAPAPPPPALSLRIEKATLDNGLRVVMNIDHASPTVAVAVTYDVGSRNEERGRSGFAHLFEHMMFEGSANVPKGEHFKLISSHGGTLNGTTSTDRTNYFEMLPASELPLVLWLEADRMKSLNVSAENFENQRKVVQEEYRMRVSNVPYAPAEIRLNELIFQGYWPYEHDTIGSMQDLDHAEIDWVRAFHESHYAPNLAVLTIAGDFEPEEAMQLVHRFFDTAKKQEKVIAYEPPPEVPEQSTARSASLEDSHAKTPAFYYGWAIPPDREPDHYALELASAVLTDGESSRLHQKLVREKAIAQEVSSGTDDHRGPDSFQIEVKLAEGARMADAQAATDALVDTLAKDGPTDGEMTKVQSRIESAFLFGLQSNLQRAIKLGQFELFWGDARLLNNEPAKYFAVTKEDIKRVMQKYLVPARRTVVEARPTGMVDPPARSASPPPVARAATAQKPRDKGKTSKAATAGGKEIEGGRHKPRHHKEAP